MGRQIICSDEYIQKNCLNVNGGSSRIVFTRVRQMIYRSSFSFTINQVCGICLFEKKLLTFIVGSLVNITAIVIIVFYFAIIIVPLVLVVRQSLKEITRLQSEIPDKKERRKNHG